MAFFTSHTHSFCGKVPTGIFLKNYHSKQLCSACVRYTNYLERTESRSQNITTINHYRYWLTFVILSTTQLLKYSKVHNWQDNSSTYYHRMLASDCLHTDTTMHDSKAESRYAKTYPLREQEIIRFDLIGSGMLNYVVGCGECEMCRVRRKN